MEPQTGRTRHPSRCSLEMDGDGARAASGQVWVWEADVVGPGRESRWLIDRGGSFREQASATVCGVHRPMTNRSKNKKKKKNDERKVSGSFELGLIGTCVGWMANHREAGVKIRKNKFLQTTIEIIIFFFFFVLFFCLVFFSVFLQEG